MADHMTAPRTALDGPKVLYAIPHVSARDLWVIATTKKSGAKNYAIGYGVPGRIDEYIPKSAYDAIVAENARLMAAVARSDARLKWLLRNGLLTARGIIHVGSDLTIDHAHAAIDAAMEGKP